MAGSMVLTTLILAGLAVACSGEGVDAPPPDPMTWHGGVGEVVLSRCGACHQPGGAGPMALDSPQAFAANAEEALASIRNGTMPPWQPEPSCREFAHQRVMPKEERDRLAQWVELGQPLGRPVADSGDAERDELGDEAARRLGPPTIEAGTGSAYTPDGRRPDDYRCFLLDADFPDGAFISALETVPGDAATVHHVLYFLISKGDVAEAEAAMADSPIPGYRCFGGPGIDTATQTLAGWAPGMPPTRLPEDSALRIPAGGRIIMQVHYNTLTARPAPDATLLRLWLRESGDDPRYITTPRPLANIMFELPAGQRSSVWEETFTNFGDEPWVVTGVAPHMHLLGRWIRADVLNASGDERACLVDIPDWDFAWQQFYEFLPGEELEVAPGEAVRLTCGYDNSESAQPVVNGERLQPRDVTWGSGTLDEMCLNFLVVRTEYDPAAPDATKCAGADLCMRNCEPGDPVCHVACASAAPGGCPECMTLKLAACGSRLCSDHVTALAPCLQPCYFSGGADLAACLQQTCPAELDSFWQCFQPGLYDGQCNDEFADCNIEF